MRFSRRAFLRNASAAGVMLGALPRLAKAQASDEPNTDASTNNGRYGPLLADPQGLLDLPQGFAYTVISETGQEMSDGLRTPGRPDGMGCFPGPRLGTVTLVRNHENYWVNRPGSAFDENLDAATRIPPELIYDFHPDGPPCPGGTTTLVYDLAAKRILRSHLSLAGTLVNCAGGVTPWGSWLSCEELVNEPEYNLNKEHGFVFEVPSAETGLVTPVPLTAMGRFVHEACAVDPVSHAIYMTEDENDSLFYRFLPNEPENLSAGGRLQFLALEGDVPSDTRNWATDVGGLGESTFPQNTPVPVRWIDVADPLAGDEPLRTTGTAAGAAVFARGEGITFALDEGGRSICFTCTSGGAAKIGQVWRYRPGAHEGTAQEVGATLEILYESNAASVLEKVDNIAFAPWHDLILCEDGRGDNYLRGLTPEGQVYDIARNAHESGSEFCGACFSPDGATMFVNVQVPGFTFAIAGPWDIVRGG